jgi:hypothetical protein
MRAILNHLADLWCRVMHTGALWPVGGFYRCRQCLRSHPVCWERG